MFFFLILLVVQRKWVSVTKLIITGFLSGFTAVLIFPAMIRHIFYGYRGKDTFLNLKQSIDKYWFKLLAFYKLINKDLFGNYFNILILCLFTLIFINIFKKKLETKDYFYQITNNTFIKKTTIKYIVILASSLIYFLFISKIAVYNVTRYMVPIYSITISSFFSLIISLFINVFKNKVYSYALIVLFFTFVFGNEYKIFWKEIFKTSLHDVFEYYSNLDCIFIYDISWKILINLFKYKNCRMIKFIKKIQINSKTFSEDKMNQLILMALKESKIDINKLIKLFPKVNEYKKISNSNLEIYYLFKK
jgi:hypothetical protein